MMRAGSSPLERLPIAKHNLKLSLQMSKKTGEQGFASGFQYMDFFSLI
jgi:hypothetical protein